MKCSKLSLLAIALVGVAGYANAEVTGNLGVTTNYVWRGLTQNSNNPALQGGFDYAHEDTGFYAGLWGSNVAQTGSLEADVYGGVSGETDFEMGWDVGLLYYAYPGTPDASEGGVDDIFEGYAGLSYKFAKFTTYYNENNDTYLDLSLNYALPEDFRLGAHAGQTILDLQRHGAYGDYADYNVSLGRALGNGFDMSFVIWMTSSDVEAGTEKDDKIRFVATVTKEL